LCFRVRNDRIERPRRMPMLMARLRSLVCADSNTVRRRTTNTAQNAGTNLQTLVLLDMLVP